MAVFANWNLTQFLTATPYTPFDGEAGNTNFDPDMISEEDFYKEGFFLEPYSWKVKAQNILSFFNKTATGSDLSTVLLYGYQGTGKTTFLHWALKKTDLFSKYGKMILNMEKINPSVDETNPYYVFDVFFRHQLNLFFEKRPADVVDFLKLLLTHMLTLSSISINTKYDDQTFWNKAKALIHKLDSPDISNPDIDDKEAMMDFSKSLNYNDTFLLFLLLYFRLNDVDYVKEFGFSKPVEFEQGQKFLIAFDNIDGVRIEQTNASFPAKIADVYNQFCFIIKKLNWPIPRLVFIFSVRDFNHSLLEYQRTDFRHIEEIQFDSPDNIDGIMEKRVEIAKNHKKDANASYIFKVFFHDAKFEKIFLPLFNYNIRKLARSFSEISETLNVENAQSFLNIRKEFKSDSSYKLPDMFKQDIGEVVKENNDSRNGNTNVFLPSFYANGLRGLFYAIIIKALLKGDFLKTTLLYEEGRGVESFVDEKGEKHIIKINPARILLTIIHSLTEYNDDEDKRGDFVGLGKVYKDYKKMFKDIEFVDVFFDRLAKLFLLYKANWCHLVSFRNKHVYNETVFAEEKKQLRELLQNEPDNDEFEFLNDIEVRINRSAHIYLTKVVTHYEFYSMRVNNANALFLVVDEKTCLENMDKVWNLVGPCLSDLISYLQQNTVENFEETNLCLRDNYREGSSKAVLAFRIIHTHIRYIDDFRKFIHFLCSTKRTEIIFERLNKEIVRRQIRYINKLKMLCKVRPVQYDTRKKEFLENFNKQRDLGYDHYFSLLNENRDQPTDGIY